MPEVRLRPYQWDGVQFIAGMVADGHRRLAFVMPTGSGKSHVLRATILKSRALFKTSTIAVPLLSIEQNFVPTTDMFYTADPVEVGGSGALVRMALSAGSYKAMRHTDDDYSSYVDWVLDEDAVVRNKVTTHARLALWADTTLPNDLAGCVLVIDEAHHIGLGAEGTKIGKFVEEWHKQGGTVIYLTATPYRTDGRQVFPDDTKVFNWSIADHSASGYAPATFRISSAVVDGVWDVKSVAGDTLSKDEKGNKAGLKAAVQRWVDDGYPKSVFTVPPAGSVAYSKILVEAIKAAKPDARVVNAVGTSKTAQDRFTAALEREAGVTRYEDSTVDVFVACKRFDEGTDWPLCSHVYQWGLSKSFGLIMQRWGRSFRDKSTIEGYPEQHKDKAVLTFFVGGMTARTLKEYERKHHDNAFLIACYMSDPDTALNYSATFRNLYARVRKRNRTVSDVTKRLHELRDLQDVQVHDGLRNQALAEMAKYDAQWKAAHDGESPTAKNYTRYFEGVYRAGKFSDDLMRAIYLRLAEIITSGDGAEDAVTKAAKDMPDAPVREDMLKFFRSVVDQYADQTVSVSDPAMAAYTEFTGQEALNVSIRVGRAVWYPLVTPKSIREAAQKFINDNGYPPNQKSGPAIAYFGFPIDWSRVDTWLRKGTTVLPGGSSLSDFLYSNGMGGIPIKPRNVWGDTPELHVIKAGILKCLEDTGSLPPTYGETDISRWFGSKLTGRILNSRMPSLGYNSLTTLYIEMGLSQHNEDLDLPTIKAEYERIYAETGSFPGGKVMSPFGVTWASINTYLYIGRRGLPGGNSLRQFKEEIDPGMKKGRLSTDIVHEAMKAFFLDQGTRPRQDSGDATAYFGYRETWMNIEKALKHGRRGLPGGSSLYRASIDIGLV